MTPMGVPDLEAPAPPGAALPVSAERKPSGIPAAAVVPDRGALVRSGLPSRRRLGGHPAPPAK
ncbi:MAG: hypothetical protein ACE5MM_09675, partial [Nitrospiraceae bacterium]